MPEATVLFSVTAAVVVGLVAWVAVVLKTAKEPWARPAPLAPVAPARAEDVPVEPIAVVKPETEAEAKEKAEEKAEAKAEADADAVVEKAEAKAEEKAEAEAKADAETTAMSDAKVKADEAAK